MQLTEVIIENKKRNCGSQIRPFARKGIRQSGQASQPHSRGQVHALNVRSADRIHVGAAEPRLFDRALQSWRTVSGWAVRHSGVDLHQLNAAELRPHY